MREFLKPSEKKYYMFFIIIFIVNPLFLLVLYSPIGFLNIIYIFFSVYTNLTYNLLSPSGSLLAFPLILLSGFFYIVSMYILACFFVKIYYNFKKEKNIWTLRIIFAIALILIGMLSSLFLYWLATSSDSALGSSRLPGKLIEITDSYCGENGTATVSLRSTGTQTVDLGTCTVPTITDRYECGDLKVTKADNSSMNANLSKSQIAPGELALFEDRACASGELCSYRFRISVQGLNRTYNRTVRATVQC